MKKKRDTRAKLADRRRQQSDKRQKIHTLIDELKVELEKARLETSQPIYDIMKQQDEIKITGT